MPTALQDLKFFKKSGNKQIISKIQNILQSIAETPFTGIGKPERLKHEWSGYWSRRITDEHRMIYKVESKSIIIYAFRFHYE